MLLVGLLLFAAFVLTEVSRWILAPWSISTDGSPTLTGTWVGPLRSKWGSEYHLLVNVDWDPPRTRRGSRRRRPDGRLVGEALVCNRAGKEFRLTVSGDANRSASDVQIDLEARDSQYRESLPLQGSWHGETLQMSAFTSPFGQEGELRGARSSVSSSTTDKDGQFVSLYPENLGPNQIPADSFPEVTLKKGGQADYEAGCRALRQ